MGETRCFVSGVFDLLHDGHKNILKWAKENYDICIIAITTDNHAKNYKRVPYEDQYKRRQNIIDLGLFDPNYFDWEEGDNHIDLYDKWNITHLLHGDDWDIDVYLEHMGGKIEIEKRNIKVDIIPYTEGVSSTKLLKEIGYIE